MDLPRILMIGPLPASSFTTLPTGSASIWILWWCHMCSRSVGIKACLASWMVALKNMLKKPSYSTISRSTQLTQANCNYWLLRTSASGISTPCTSIPLTQACKVAHVVYNVVSPNANLHNILLGLALISGFHQKAWKRCIDDWAKNFGRDNWHNISLAPYLCIPYLGWDRGKQHCMWMVEIGNALGACL